MKMCNTASEKFTSLLHQVNTLYHACTRSDCVIFVELSDT